MNKDITYPLYRAQFLKTADGTEIQLPAKVTWKQEKEILGIIGDIYESFPEIREWNLSEKVKPEKILTLLPEIFRRVPDHLTRLVSVLLGKEPAWIEENLNMDAILEVAYPFLGYIGVLFKKYWTKNKTPSALKSI